MSGQTIHLDGERRGTENAISSYIEWRNRYCIAGMKALAQWSAQKDACVTFGRESLTCLARFFPGDLGALFARFGKPDSDGLLAALYAPSLATFAGAQRA